ncbi:ATP-grasp domain-containing protein [Desulfobacter sp.]|uniref:ATP-grasp domain-containing protein n=1 Tax=Desulfobacter sp. TaxID=2294 RepID=UPI002580EE5E|nr:ATP-grasp domain-containing protein [Desulfobacter sp.]
MQLTGLKYGKQLMDIVDFPVAETLTENATKEQIEALIKKGGKVVVKPSFMGSAGKKGKAGLVKIVDNYADANQARKDLCFAEYKQGNTTHKANGCTFEEFVASDAELYVSITTSTITRTPTMLLIVEGGVEVEELPPEKKAIIPFNPNEGLRGYHVNDALIKLGCPKAFISPLVQQIPKLWDLYNNYGLTMIEINPIRMQKGKRPVPVACDVKAAFDQDDPAHTRITFPKEVFATELTDFETEINQLRTYQGQSDVVELNPNGTILPFMFGGGANSAATEVLGDKAMFSSDFGGNPPYAKMKEIASISYKHFLKNANIVQIIGGKANNTDIFVTIKAMLDALRENIHLNPNIQVIIGRGGPNVVQGMIYARDLLDSMKVPYKMFGFDSSMIGVLNYTLELDAWITANKK